MFPSPGSGPPAIFQLFFALFFVAFAVAVFVAVVKGLARAGEWMSNNAQPEQSEEATVVAKRTEVGGGKNSTSTTYFATFETDGSQRRELEVEGRDYGQLAEGDRGRLTYQGSRFLDFQRAVAKVKEDLVEPPAPPERLLCTYCGSAIPRGTIKCGSCGWTWRPALPPDPVS